MLKICVLFFFALVTISQANIIERQNVEGRSNLNDDYDVNLSGAGAANEDPDAEERFAYGGPRANSAAHAAANAGAFRGNYLGGPPGRYYPGGRGQYASANAAASAASGNSFYGGGGRYRPYYSNANAKANANAYRYHGYYGR